MADIELDYDSLMQNALRQVVRDVLAITAELDQTPGDHHFYIEFDTSAQNVVIPDHLRESYPSRMTIVLHHQFENLSVTDNGFSVTLWFKGIEANLHIPFDAMTSFADPSAKFGLRFQEDDAKTAMAQNPDIPTTREDNTQSIETEESTKEEDKTSEKDSSADVVSLDSFRKK